MDARAEAEKRYPYGVWMVTADDIGWVDSERDAFVAGAVWALREYASRYDATHGFGGRTILGNAIRRHADEIEAAP